MHIPCDFGSVQMPATENTISNLHLHMEESIKWDACISGLLANIAPMHC
jgi:hypothetical protein